MKKLYFCRVCGAEFYTPYVRCIGEDGKHPPTVTQPKREQS